LEAKLTFYKFLTRDGLGIFSGFGWPLPRDGPGSWVTADVELCRSGIHACRADDLPYWLAPTLYEIELEGDVIAHPTKVVAPRGRLTRRIDAWNEVSLEEYGRMCRARAEELVAAAPEDLEGWRPPAAVAPHEAARLGFMAARIAEHVRGLEGFLAERTLQSEWLLERLALD
jgi:hypothetical protein